MAIPSPFSDHTSPARAGSRAVVAGADTVEASTLDGEPLGKLERRNANGFFEGKVALTGQQPVRYRAANSGGQWLFVDPYSFGPILGPMDDYYSAEGTHLRLFDKLGAHVLEHEGVTGVHFAVWAPSAAARLGGRRFQRLGRAAPHHAPAHLRGLGDIPARTRTGHDLQIRDRRRRRQAAAAQGGPVRLCLGVAAEDCVGGGRPGAVHLGRRHSPAGPAARQPPGADLDLRGPPRLVAAGVPTAASSPTTSSPTSSSPMSPISASPTSS